MSPRRAPSSVLRRGVAAGNYRRPAIALLVGMTTMLIGVTGAGAAWLAKSPATAAARARTIATSATPTAAFSRPRVTISWTASAFVEGGTVPRYVVRRYNAVTGIGVPAGNSCAGLVTGLSCAENAPAGTWRYTITAAAGNWRGVESAQSLPVVVV
jgi:hypothetical protein